MGHPQISKAFALRGSKSAAKIKKAQNKRKITLLTNNLPIDAAEGNVWPTLKQEMSNFP
jgi:hypothetical protein